MTYKNKRRTPAEKKGKGNIMKRTFTERELTTLENHGYTHIYAVVKSVYNTVYVNCRSISAIRKNGNKWIAATQWNGDWQGPIGITKPAMFAKYGESKCAGYAVIRYSLPKWLEATEGEATEETEA